MADHQPDSRTEALRAKNEITSWHRYGPTSLRDLSALAEDAGVQCIRLKDESERFGLGSFKALGGAYAVVEVLSVELVRRGQLADHLVPSRIIIIVMAVYNAQLYTT
jgi:hypothetical protein